MYKLLSIFGIIVFCITAVGNTITNVRENVTNVNSNSSINTGVDLGQGSSNECIKGNGDIVSRNRSLDKFSKIIIDGDFNVKINCEGDNDISLKGDSNILPVIETNVSGETLTIKPKQPVNLSKTIELVINSDKLSNLTLTGVEKISVDNIKNDIFVLNITTGTADVVLSGDADELQIKAMGNGNIDASTFNCKSAAVKVMGDCEVHLGSYKSLKVNIIGDAKVYYKGSPDIKKHLLGGSLQKY